MLTVPLIWNIPWYPNKICYNNAATIDVEGYLVTFHNYKPGLEEIFVPLVGGVQAVP